MSVQSISKNFNIYEAEAARMGRIVNSTDDVNTLIKACQSKKTLWTHATIATTMLTVAAAAAIIGLILMPMLAATVPALPAAASLGQALGQMYLLPFIAMVQTTGEILGLAGIVATACSAIWPPALIGCKIIEHSNNIKQLENSEFIEFANNNKIKLSMENLRKAISAWNYAQRSDQLIRGLQEHSV
ncbi:MAG TPA: hypothetical protein VLE95_06965 [Chlamydiales bacterium]|nr:hypothetical protein [Chlamydiales bacterium]